MRPAHPPEGAVPSASMRPGPRGPGNHEPDVQRAGVRRASMRPGPRGPGNSGAGPTFSPWGMRFNEAGAARPRKCPGYEYRVADMPRASMRPGPRGPGNPAGSARATGSPCSFNEAGAARPRKSGRARVKVGAGRVASMRPGPRGPGNLAREEAVMLFAAPASMRPGPRGPGNAVALLVDLYAARLGFNEAGAARPRKLGVTRPWSVLISALQ